jgi:hypothetical protein
VKIPGFQCFHIEKIKETKYFKNSAPFQLFLGKSGQNLAKDLSCRLIFIWPLLNYAAEESASWEHLAEPKGGPQSGNGGTKGEHLVDGAALQSIGLQVVGCSWLMFD